jgi:tetratricopeptide (TPR) repeat protein
MFKLGIFGLFLIIGFMIIPVNLVSAQMGDSWNNPCSGYGYDTKWANELILCFQDNPNIVNDFEGVANDVGYAYSILNDNEKAIFYYKLALEQDPKNGGTLAMLCYAYLDEKEYAIAYDYASQAVSLGHDDVGTTICLDNAERVVKAQENMEKRMAELELKEKAEQEAKIAQLEAQLEAQEKAEQERITQLEKKEKVQELGMMMENMIDDANTQVSQMEKSLSGLEYQSDEANAELDNAWKFKTKALYHYEIVISTATILKDLANEGNFEKLQKQASDPKFSEKSKNAGMGLEENMKNVYSLIDNANQIELSYLQKQEAERNSGGCLIATATYGSELSPQVQQLRELRDNQLLQTESGTAFMGMFNDIYYSFSPTIADMERESPLFKEIVKLAITPMISSLSLMENAESESEVLSIGISVIMLNLGMYLGVPAIVIVGIRKKF